MRPVSAVLVWIVVVSSAAAQGPVPRFGEFEVSSVVTYGAWPEIATGDTGDFVVVWDQNFFTTIRARRFAADGAPLSDNFQINTDTATYQIRPKVRIGPLGDFSVVWQGGVFNDGQDGSSSGIMLRRFDSDGAPMGDEMVVNTYTTNSQTAPAISMSATGEFIIVWASAESIGPDADASIQAQRYMANGTPLGSELQLNTYTTGNQAVPSVGHAPNGDFVVVWHSIGSPGNDNAGSSVVGRRFAADGTPMGGDFQVNSFTPNNQYWPQVAVGPGGDFMVVWTNRTATVEGQRFNADGSPEGTQFQVNTYVSPQHRYPTVASSPHGEFLVTWSSGFHDVCCPGPDGSFYATAAQLFAGVDGSLTDEGKLGGELVVNTNTVSSQWRSSVTAGPDGVFTVVWQDSSWPRGQQLDTPILGDGFESGDTSAWSNSVP